MNNQKPFGKQARCDSGTDTAAVVPAIVLFFCAKEHMCYLKPAGRRL